MTDKFKMNKINIDMHIISVSKNIKNILIRVITFYNIRKISE
jgi:hypothetical protein